MKFVNQLRKASLESPQSKAARPIVKPRKNTLISKQKGTAHDEQFLFI